MTYRLVVPFISLLMLSSITETHGAVLFAESFAKDVSGQINTVRTFNASAGAAVITFTNGGESFDQVRKGTILLNGEVVFGSHDFSVNGSIVKKVPVGTGVNTLAIQLSGPTGGQMRLEVSQGIDVPVLEFPPGTIYVSSLGADTSTCGSLRNAACRTIRFGLQRASTAGGGPVAVASGIYPESVPLISGINVLGGYDSEFSRRDIASMRPIIRGEGTSSETVAAFNIVNDTVFEGFLVIGPTVTVPSSNSIGIHVRNSTSALTIMNNVILAGVGAAGTAGSHGAPADHGQPGLSGVDAGGAPVLGGVGGLPNGGRGGNSTAPVFGLANGPGATGAAGISGGGNGGTGGSGGKNAKFSLDGNCFALLPTNGSIDAGDGVRGRLSRTGKRSRSRPSSGAPRCSNRCR